MLEQKRGSPKLLPQSWKHSIVPGHPQKNNSIEDCFISQWYEIIIPLIFLHIIWILGPQYGYELGSSLDPSSTGLYSSSGNILLDFAKAKAQLPACQTERRDFVTSQNTSVETAPESCGGVLHTTQFNANIMLGNVRLACSCSVMETSAMKLPVQFLLLMLIPEEV